MGNLEEKQPTQPQPAAEEPTPPPVSQPVSQPLTPEVKPKKSFLLPVLLSLGTLVLGGSLVFAYFTFLKPEEVVPQPVVSPTPVSMTTPSPLPNPDITADWETYYNEDFGVELKYPSDWNIRVAEEVWENRLLGIFLNKKDLTQEPVVLPGETTAEASYLISFMLFSNPQNYSAKDFYLNRFELSSRSKAEEEIEVITIGNINGIKYSEGAAPSSGAVTVVMVAKNNKIYRFDYSAMAHVETHEKFIPIFNQILSTFRFLD